MDNITEITLSHFNKGNIIFLYENVCCNNLKEDIVKINAIK